MTDLVAQSDDVVLVTGGSGCIGAWTLRGLVDRSITALSFDVGEDLDRLRLVLGDARLAAVRRIRGDITDGDALDRVIADHGVTHLVHLAAMQVPACRADPRSAALVNVVGTVNVFEAAKRHRDRVRSIVYLSSVGMFAMADAESSTRTLRADADAHPETMYGVTKLACEGAAKVYWLADGIPSIGLRPYVVYGPGRDQGLTSAPTKAMRSIVLGESAHIPYGGRAQYQFAEDVAGTILDAALYGPRDGAHVGNLDGVVASMAQVVAAIEKVVPEAAGQITFDDRPLPFPEGADPAALHAVLGPSRVTSLEAGVRRTIDHFRAHETLRAGP